MAKKDWGMDVACRLDNQPPYPEVFDTIIMGGGPAGMTAAIYAARRKMKALLIGGDIGGQMMSSSDIENWTGVAQATGPELTRQFFDHVSRVDDDNAHFDLWVRPNEKVITVSGNAKDKFIVTTDKQIFFTAKTLICVTGKVPRTLNIPGEAVAMQGNGLSFCPTCDAPLYRGKKMAIVGGGNSAMDVALQLEKLTEDVTIFTNLDAMIGETCMMEKVNRSPRISVEYGVDTQEVLLNEKSKVRGLKYAQGGEEKEFACEGIFEEIGQTPATGFLKEFITLNDGGEIPTNRRCQTGIPGFFAGGDCSDQVHKQVVVAAAEGAVCTLEAHEFLLRQKD
jgi:alkyl hydroperoxide reductase subunit F